MSSTYIKVLMERWHAMSVEDREAAMRGAVGDLVARRSSRQRGIHNIAQVAFNDVNRTLTTIQREVSHICPGMHLHVVADHQNGQLELLHERTGFEFVLIVVCATIDQYLSPYFFYTSERVGQFFEIVSKSSVSDFVGHLEGWCIAGVDGK